MQVFFMTTQSHFFRAVAIVMLLEVHPILLGIINIFTAFLPFHDCITL